MTTADASTGPATDPANDPANDAELDRDQRREARATMLLGGLLVIIAVVVIVQAARLDNGNDVIGAATMPWVVGVLLFLVGIALALTGRRDLAGTHGWVSTPQDWQRLAVMLVALVVFAVVIGFLGYVVSATLLFGVTAIVLGAPYRLRAFAYGFSVAALVFLAFDVFIGITLPAGPWGF